MESINFEVGAKAARLIGRENIANADGALVELIKNSYDADASCVCVYFDMPFPYVPETISAELAKQVFSTDDFNFVKKYYTRECDEGFHLKMNLSPEAVLDLRLFLMSFNRVIIADNGHGMNPADVKTKWMYIGTSDKEIHTKSPKGRVKTGAKGIGRFALDKLSIHTEMITQKEESGLVSWEINWEQFENTKLLSQVSAVVSVTDDTYDSRVKLLLEKRFPKCFRDYLWKSGTMLILSPIREDWSLRLFEKVNTNLKSINPLGTADPFRVFVKNRYFPDYNFETAETSISEKDYDYRIQANFDGKRYLRVTLGRNEVDINKKTITIKKYDRRVSLLSFWERPYFQKEGYRRADFASYIETEMDITEMLPDDPAKISGVGPFEAQLFFGKNVKSSEEIIKGIVARDRKKLYGTFSGIKIYRDGFKVRPYGDDGTYLDWLGLGRRQTLSPGGVGDVNHDWKVLAYQIIGQIKISRNDNPGLYDMANREGLKQNDEYQIFCELLLLAIDYFERDRRNFYREYTKWREDITKGFGTDASIRADVLEKAKKKRDKPSESNEETSESKYSEEEYQETVYNLIREKERMLDAQQILQMLSSSGMILNTFFHEFKAIESQFGARAPQLRKRLNYMVENGNLSPGMIYDPFLIIDSMQDTDAMMALWLELAMNSLEKQKLDIRSLDLLKELEQAVCRWENILKRKGIQIAVRADRSVEYPYSFSIADLYIIVNNFMLNSVYFLERGRNEDRRIVVSLTAFKDFYNIRMWNNGPELDNRYRAMPDRIFELGESSKINGDGSQGTGVGLWISRTVVERYGGAISVLDNGNGFGLEMHLKR